MTVAFVSPALHAAAGPLSASVSDARLDAEEAFDSEREMASHPRLAELVLRATAAEAGWPPVLETEVGGRIRDGAGIPFFAPGHEIGDNILEADHNAV